MNPTIARILVPTDFSACSEEALRYGLALADRCGATVHLLHVVDLTITPGLASELPLPVDMQTMQAEAAADAERDLAAFLHRHGKLASMTTSVVVGRPAPTIIEVAGNLAVDLIVMGTHGRRGFAHLMLGSVAEHVVRAAPCPVLTVRHKAADAGTGAGAAARDVA